MHKVMRIGTTKQGRRWASIYIEASNIDKLNNNNSLSIHGVIGPLPSGNSLGGCGQIDMEFTHRNPEDNDKRWGDNLISISEIVFTEGWDYNKWWDLLDIWKQWHLKTDYPQSVIDFIVSLPDADKEPAWI